MSFSIGKKEYPDPSKGEGEKVRKDSFFPMERKYTGKEGEEESDEFGSIKKYPPPPEKKEGEGARGGSFFPIIRKYTGGALEKLVLIKEAKRLDKFFKTNPQEIAGKKARSIKSFASALRVGVGTKGDERKIVEMLSSKGFGGLSSEKGLTFLKENY